MSDQGGKTFRILTMKPPTKITLESAREKECDIPVLIYSMDTIDTGRGVCLVRNSLV